MTLIMTNDRLRDIVSVVKTLAQRHIYTLPVDIEHLCVLYGARMTSLDDAAALGLDPEIVTRCIGNRDGVATRGKKVWGIIYNKNAPVNRLRFTLAEEFMHHILGHTLDPRFGALDPTYSPEMYARYEEEAKKAADLLLVSPYVYYRYRRRMSIPEMSRLFAVSGLCMSLAADFYDQKEEIVRPAWGLCSPLMEKVSASAAKLVRERQAVAVKYN